MVLHVPTLGMLIQSLRLLQPRTTRRKVCLPDVVTGLAISPLENGPSDCGNLGEDGLEGLFLQVQGLLFFGAKRSHPWFHAYSLGGHPPSPHLFSSNQVISPTALEAMERFRSLNAAPNHSRPFLGRDPIAFSCWTETQLARSSSREVRIRVPFFL